MPREYNSIQRGELQQRLTRGLLINEKSPAPTLDPTVQACVILEDLSKQNPSQSPADRRCGGGEIIGAGGAGLFGQVSLLNPLGSNTIMVVEAFTARVNGTLPCIWGFSSAVIGAPAARGFFYDPRYGIPGSIFPTALIYQGTTAAPTIGIGTAGIMGRLSTGTTTTQGQIDLGGVVLIPGIAFAVSTEVANAEFSAHFRWVEYSLQ